MKVIFAPIQNYVSAGKAKLKPVLRSRFRLSNSPSQKIHVLYSTAKTQHVNCELGVSEKRLNVQEFGGTGGCSQASDKIAEVAFRFCQGAWYNRCSSCLSTR